jgi:hypothetical protein
MDQSVTFLVQTLRALWSDEVKGEVETGETLTPGSQLYVR